MVVRRVGIANSNVVLGAQGKVGEVLKEDGASLTKRGEVIVSKWHTVEQDGA
jgi:hypothetical protein